MTHPTPPWTSTVQHGTSKQSKGPAVSASLWDAQLSIKRIPGRESCPQWLDQAGIQHGFCGYDSEPPSYAGVKQVHGHVIVSSEAAGSEADGIYSCIPGQRIGIQTADCLPILACAAGFGAAVHAGWRGTAKGILATLASVIAAEQRAIHEVRFLIGPAISMDHFEVGPEVASALKAAPFAIPKPDLLLCFRAGTGDRLFVDLAAIAALQLLSLGALPAHIVMMASCTYAEATRWPSYRRMGSAAGRIISWLEVPPAS